MLRFIEGYVEGGISLISHWMQRFALAEELAVFSLLNPIPVLLPIRVATVICKDIGLTPALFKPNYTYL